VIDYRTTVSVEYCCSVGVLGQASLIRDIHGLKVPERIKFRLCVLTHRCLHGTAPPYPVETLQLTSDMSTRRHLPSAAMPTDPVDPPFGSLFSAIERFLWLPHAPGTFFRLR